MSKKIGVVVGKFYPLHVGHVDLIQKASTENDLVIVVVSHSDKRDNRLFEDSNLKRRLTAKTKLKIVQKTFQQQRDLIIPVLVDESNIAEYPNGWLEWAELVKEAVESKREIETFDWNNVTFYTSEPQDVENYKKYFGSNSNIVDEKRVNVNISATKIRNNPSKYWDYLPRASREELAPTIAICGGESSGKTIMTDRLGNYFATTTVWEYGRNYCEEELGGDESALQYEDYQNICNGHYQDVLYARRNANKVVISDTDYVTTQAFAITYEGRPHPSVQDKIDNDKFDLTILLDNSTAWVDDGMRLLGKDEDRKKFQLLLKRLYNKNGIDYVEISAKDYSKRYEICKEVIRQYLDKKLSVLELQKIVDNMEEDYYGG